MLENYGKAWQSYIKILLQFYCKSCSRETRPLSRDDWQPLRTPRQAHLGRQTSQGFPTKSNQFSWRNLGGLRSEAKKHGVCWSSLYLLGYSKCKDSRSPICDCFVGLWDLKNHEFGMWVHILSYTDNMIISLATNKTKVNLLLTSVIASEKLLNRFKCTTKC